MAAGASTRMGQPKQLLPWGKYSLLQHAIDVAKTVKANKVIVVLGAHHEAISSSIENDVISIIVNPNWKNGLGASIAYSANHILNEKEKVSGVLFVLADQPFVTSNYLNEMLTSFQPCESKIIATEYSSGKIGVPVLFDSIYLSELAQLTGDNGAKSILKTHKSAMKVLTPNFENKDIDTKADYNMLNLDF